MIQSPSRLRAVLSSEQWERNVHALTLAVFVAFTGFTIVMPFLPLYVRQLGVTDEAQVALWSGVIFGVSPLLAGLFAPLWCAVADRYGGKPMIVGSLAAFIAVMALTGIATSVVQVFVLRILVGIFSGYPATATAMITMSAPEERASAAIGRMQAAIMLTNASGPLLGGLLASELGIRNTFFVSSAFYGLGLLAMVVFFKEPPRASKQPATQSRLPFRRILLLPALMPLALVLFLSRSVDRGLSPLYPLYVEAVGAAPQSVALWTGALLSLGALASAIAATGVGRIVGHASMRPLLLITLLGGVVAMLLLAAVQGVVQLLLARVALGMLVGGTLTLAYTIAARLLPVESRGAGFGLLSMGLLIGGGLSPFAAGGIAAVNIRLAFVAGAVLYALAALFALRLPSRTEGESRVRR